MDPKAFDNLIDRVIALDTDTQHHDLDHSISDGAKLSMLTEKHQG